MTLVKYVLRGSCKAKTPDNKVYKWIKVGTEVIVATDVEPVLSAFKELLAANQMVLDARYEETGYRNAGDRMEKAWEEAQRLLDRMGK